MSMDDRVWREGDPKWTWLLGESVPRYMFSQIPHNFIVDKLNELEAAELLITTLYDSGCLDIEREELVRKHIYGASHE